MLSISSLTRRLLGCVLSGGLVVSATAQELVVDLQNGPGTDFTQIQDAVDAAAPGTTIRVRPGRYDPVLIRKGVRVVGGPGVEIDELPSSSLIGLRIQDLPAGQTCVVTEVLALGQIGPTLRFNDGLVVLDRVTQLVFQANDCDSLELRDCNGPIEFQQVTANISGHRALEAHGSLSGPNVLLFDSQVSIADSVLIAPAFGTLGSESIRMIQSSLRVSLRAPGSRIYAASGSSDAAIVGVGSIAWDPSSDIRGDGTAPPILVGGAQPSSIGTLDVDGGVLGAPLQTSLRAPVGAPQLLLLGVPRTPTAVPGVAGLCAVATPEVLQFGAVPGSGVASFAVSLPQEPVLIGLAVVFQGLTAAPAGPPQWTNAVHLALR